MMAEELGIGKDVVFVMDRGFCSTANRGFMHAGGISYVMGVDARHKTTRATIDTVRGGMDRVPAKPCGQRRLRERGTIKVLHGVIRDTRLLDITEHRHHRELDLFLSLDYRVQNNTDRTFKFVISLTPTHL
jgi:transposase